ncbi:hypothetical protein B0T10DRAFT_590092 [Thelonectria olida]|uniref:Uncharacterized protein n=1 Tax=Thelonectria olida TaxID=1576542 RepID=A0A9P8WA45_9HYPO|nr:hypothetical protein B0T10DRAFT_590092 [Thelonectria olida]
MADHKRLQEENIDRDTRQAKREKHDQPAETSLGDLYKIQLILYPPAAPTPDGKEVESLSIQGSLVKVVEARGHDNPFPQLRNWLIPVNGIVLPRDSGVARLLDDNYGTCVSKIIRRSQIRLGFYNRIRKATTEIIQMGFELLDQRGCLKQVYKFDLAWEGFGIWGNEFDTGDILLIEEFHIKRGSHGFEIGEMLFQVIVNKAQSMTSKFFVIASPTALALEGPNGNLTWERGVSIEFWRRLGFRRIGTSDWFGFTTDVNHGCHALSAADDYDPPAPRPSVHTPKMNCLFRLMKTVDDLTAFKNLYVFTRHYPMDHCTWRSTDLTGNTLLHIASLEKKNRCTKFLMAFCPYLNQTRNDAGDLPESVFGLYALR